MRQEIIRQRMGGYVRRFRTQWLIFASAGRGDRHCYHRQGMGKNSHQRYI